MWKPIITSEHRVGSRWLHYLLADLLKMGVSPELGGNRVIELRDKAEEYMDADRIVKYHHGLPMIILSGLDNPADYAVVGVVRNPRDRSVSRAFHDYYHKKHRYKIQQLAKDDFEAVRWTVLHSRPLMPDNWRQIRELMLDGYSTRNKIYTEIPYIWTSYEWMKDDIEREINTIVTFLGVPVTDRFLRRVARMHSFKNRSGRDPGQEIRKNTWRRKGAMLDWVNWYDSEMTEFTRVVQEEYWNKLITNGRLQGE